MSDHARVTIEVEVHKESSAEVEGEWIPPTPREVAAFVQQRASHAETDDGWFVGIVTGEEYPDLDEQIGTLRETMRAALFAGIAGSDSTFSYETGTRIATEAANVAREYRRQAERMLNAEIGHLRRDLTARDETIERLHRYMADSDRVNGMMARLMQNVARELHGGEREDTLWSWADLADLVKEERRRADNLAAALHACKADRPTVHADNVWDLVLRSLDEHQRAREVEAERLAEPLMWEREGQE